MKKIIIILQICCFILFAYRDTAIFVESAKNSRFYYYSDKKFTSSFFKNCVYAETSGKAIPETSTDAYNNYIILRKHYIKWNQGLLKNKRHYRRVVTKYLISIIDKEILTDYEYVLVSPEEKYEKELHCNLVFGRWLQVKGDIQQDTFIKIVEKKPELLAKWVRSKKLISVSGRLKDFSLDSYKLGEVITIHLKDIKVKEIENDSAGKNNK
ncbi:MAG: hypothetical protein V1874_15750 [Spirochaetota bacterium]